MVIPIGLGVLGFAMIALADWAGYRKLRILKPVLWLGMVPVFMPAIIMAWNSSHDLVFPHTIVIFSWLGLPVFATLFLYSLYIEIPLRTTYIDSAQPVKVITRGTYALCRHPAFLWFIGWLTTAIFISGSLTLAIAAPVWIFSYLGCLFFEEKICCLEAFAVEYQRYRATTPMLIPTSDSIGRFWAEVISRTAVKKRTPLKERD